MSTDSRSRASELHDFHAFLGAQLAKEGDPLIPEAVVDMWRDQHPYTEDATSVRQAIRQALDDMANGDTGITLEEFDRQFRAKHGLPPIA